MVVQAPVRVGCVNPAMLTSGPCPRLWTDRARENRSGRAVEKTGKSPGKDRKERPGQPVGSGRASRPAHPPRGTGSGHPGAADTLGA